MEALGGGGKRRGQHGAGGGCGDECLRQGGHGWNPALQKDVCYIPPQVLNER
jgi:hypothetical protein